MCRLIFRLVHTSGMYVHLISYFYESIVIIIDFFRKGMH